MALSPSANQGRVNLIREMARSRGSESGSDRDSARGYDSDSQQLPALPNMTPHNASHFTSEPDFQINTSALRRAFPDFSQYGSSDDGDSLEIGRAAHSRPFHRRVLSSEDPSENISLNIGGEKFTVTGTPPMKPKTGKAPAKDALRPSAPARSTSEKENADPNRKETDFVSSAGSKASQQSNRQPLGEWDPNAQADASLNLTDERPKSITSQTRASRFTKARQATVEDETQTPATHTVSQPVDTVNSGTHQSFALPDLPNITELVSGQRMDGTPLFARSAKSRSKFMNGTPRRPNQPQLPVIDDVPVPADAQSLYLALQLLHEKVAGLETEKKEAIEKADNYELEFLQLKAALEAKQHSDSGVDVDNEEEARTKDFDAERQRFEASIKSLKAKLDRANGKLAQSEVQISQLRGDKMAAQQQLDELEANSAALRKDGRDVHDEFEDVKAQLGRVTKQHEKIVKSFTRQEAELRAKIDRRERAVKEMAFLARELWATRTAVEATSTLPRQRLPVGIRPEQRHRPSSSRASVSRVHVSQPEPREPLEPTVATTFDIDDTTFTTQLDMDAHAMPPLNQDLSKNESFMSFMEGDEVAMLRHILEQDKARHAGTGAGRVKDDTTTGLSRPASAAALPRKSSLKAQAQASASAPVYEPSEPTASGVVDGTQTSLASHRSSRRQRSSFNPADEMTSALILPDITLAGTQILDPTMTVKGVKNTIKRPVPVSERPVAPTDENPDPTIRPSQSPGLALAAVLQGLEEELARLRAHFSEQEKLYHQHDPALSKRERKAIFAKMQRLLGAIEVRCDQIYALYDVLEGQKDAGQCMDESEVEVTLQSLGIRVSRQLSKAVHQTHSRSRSNSGAATHKRRDGKTGRRKSVVIEVDADNILSDDDLPVGDSDDDYNRFGDEFEGFDSTNTNTHSVRA